MKGQKKKTGGLAALKQLMPYLGRRRISLLLTLLLAAASVVLQLYVPVLFGSAIDALTGGVDYAAMGRSLALAAALAAGSGVCTFLMNLLNNSITFRVVEDLRSDAVRHLQRIPLSYLDSHGTGDTLSRVTSDVDILSDGLLLGFTQLFSGVITIVVTLVFMFSRNILVSLIVVLLTPLSFLVARFVSSRSYRLFIRQSEIRGRQTTLIDEAVGGQKVIRAFGYEKRAQQSFDALSDELTECSTQAVFYSSLTNPSTRFVNNLVYAGVALAGVLLIPGGSLTVGGLSALLAYANRYMKPFNDISSVVTELQNALACADRVFELLGAETESPDAPSELEAPTGRIELNNVAFSYDPERPLIRDLCLHAEPGRRIAIVGPTGCGKTTLINLLMRFYDVDGGMISVDGHDIRSITRHSLRRSFGMVLQDTWLKSGTVRENIAFGKPDATDEEILSAAEAAHCLGFIRRLPQGLDTVISDNGLSQGQKQLLCIARVMLCLPPMLILDEATSSIDTNTEVKIQSAFDRLMRGRTSFIVAHRLSTVRDADTILVMRDGRVIEQGSHDELLARPGSYYAKLYNSQFAPSA